MVTKGPSSSSNRWIEETLYDYVNKRNYKSRCDPVVGRSLVKVKGQGSEKFITDGDVKIRMLSHLWSSENSQSGPAIDASQDQKWINLLDYSVTLMENMNGQPEFALMVEDFEPVQNSTFNFSAEEDLLNVNSLPSIKKLSDTVLAEKLSKELVPSSENSADLLRAINLLSTPSMDQLETTGSPSNDIERADQQSSSKSFKALDDSSHKLKEQKETEAEPSMQPKVVISPIRMPSSSSSSANMSQLLEEMVQMSPPANKDCAVCRDAFSQLKRDLDSGHGMLKSLTVPQSQREKLKQMAGWTQSQTVDSPKSSDSQSSWKLRVVLTGKNPNLLLHSRKSKAKRSASNSKTSHSKNPSSEQSQNLTQTSSKSLFGSLTSDLSNCTVPPHYNKTESSLSSHYKVLTHLLSSESFDFPSLGSQSARSISQSQSLFDSNSHQGMSQRLSSSSQSDSVSQHSDVLLNPQTPKSSNETNVVCTLGQSLSKRAAELSHLLEGWQKQDLQTKSQNSATGEPDAPTDEKLRLYPVVSLGRLTDSASSFLSERKRKYETSHSSGSLFSSSSETKDSPTGTVQTIKKTKHVTSHSTDESITSNNLEAYDFCPTVADTDSLTHIKQKVDTLRSDLPIELLNTNLLKNLPVILCDKLDVKVVDTQKRNLNSQVKQHQSLSLPPPSMSAKGDCSKPLKNPRSIQVHSKKKLFSGHSTQPSSSEHSSPLHLKPSTSTSNKRKQENSPASVPVKKCLMPTSSLSVVLQKLETELEIHNNQSKYENICPKNVPQSSKTSPKDPSVLPELSILTTVIKSSVPSQLTTPSKATNSIELSASVKSPKSIELATLSKSPSATLTAFTKFTTPSKSTAPCEPVTPSRSTTPSKSVTPSKSTTPSKSVTPTKSTTPSKSVTPTKSTTPSKSVTPTKSTTPSKSMTPTKSTTPSKSVTPTKFTTPSKSVANKSTTPSKSVTPTKSTTPSKSVTPTKSTTPSKSVTPTKSTTPSKSVTPTKSTTPSKSVTPTKSTTPSKSVTPTKSTTPSKSVTNKSTTPSKSVTPTKSTTPSKSVTPTKSTTPSKSVTPTKSTTPSKSVTNKSTTPSKSVTPTKSTILSKPVISDKSINPIALTASSYSSVATDLTNPSESSTLSKPVTPTKSVTSCKPKMPNKSTTPSKLTSVVKLTSSSDAPIATELMNQSESPTSPKCATPSKSTTTNPNKSVNLSNVPVTGIPTLRKSISFSKVSEERLLSSEHLPKVALYRLEDILKNPELDENHLIKKYLQPLNTVGTEQAERGTEEKPNVSVAALDEGKVREIQVLEDGEPMPSENCVMNLINFVTTGDRTCLTDA